MSQILSLCLRLSLVDLFVIRSMVSDTIFFNQITGLIKLIFLQAITQSLPLPLILLLTLSPLICALAVSITKHNDW